MLCSICFEVDDLNKKSKKSKSRAPVAPMTTANCNNLLIACYTSNAYVVANANRVWAPYTFTCLVAFSNNSTSFVVARMQRVWLSLTAAVPILAWEQTIRHISWRVKVGNRGPAASTFNVQGVHATLYPKEALFSKDGAPRVPPNPVGHPVFFTPAK